MDRVLIRAGEAAAMRVSLPGYDVNNASLDQLAFDARFANLEIAKSGTATIVGRNSVTLPPNMQFFDFGFTLPALPLALVSIGGFAAGNFIGNSPYFVKNYINGSLQDINYMYAIVTTSTIGFATHALGNFTVFYKIFRRVSA